MTPIHKYRLPVKYRHPNALRNALWLVGILLALYGLWYSITTARSHYLLITEVEKRIALAEADRDMLLEILKGNRPMMTEDKLEVAKIEWEEVRIVGGLE